MLTRFAAIIAGVLFSSWAYAMMSCFVHPGGVSNAPADGDTLCWADAELPKNPRTIEKEMGGLAYMCDPSWFGCSGFSGFETGRAGPGGWSPGFFTIDVQIRETQQDPCCFGRTYKFTYDVNARSLPPLIDLGKNAGPPSCPISAGNPVHLGTGNNYKRERDYLGTGVFPLRFERHYNSILGIQSRRDGWRWKHTYERRVVLDGVTAILLRETGRALYFSQVGTDWIGDPDVTGRLGRLAMGWQYIDADDSVEIYDNDGMLLSITTREGFTQTLAYDVSRRLTQVTGPFGRTLNFGYDAGGALATMTDPSGNIYFYAYNASGNLAQATYPDETPGAPNDNPTRQYHYDDPAHPDALTGITDENGVTYVTWSYDSRGRVTSNSRAGGADAITLTYDDDSGTTVLTDALGEVRTYSFETHHHSIQVSTVSGAPCTSSCSNSFASYTYDANGYLASRSDHNGNRTTFAHNARGLETRRTEAVGTPVERTITTQWHATFRLPELITVPGKTTAFTYDTEGRLLTRTETDMLSGRPRMVASTYDSRGLLATIDGPRTNTADVTRFAYNSEGSLAETTDALGHISRVTDYDPHGRPLTFQDANGLVTPFTYDMRGRLLSRDIGGRVTAFEYDGVGNLIKTTLSDGTFLASEYDEAYRLVAIEDTLGNRAEFTLDAAGNRIAETVRDSTGKLTRTRARVYDAPNQLIREIGGAGQQTDFEYDLQGNRTAVIDGNNARTTSTYDALDRLAKTFDPNSGVTTFDYDARDNLLSVIDAESLSTSYTYDGLDNLTSQSSPDTGLTQFTYDDAGNRVSQIDARGVLTQFNYDALNRLVSIQYPDSTKNTDFTYDTGPNGIGRLTRMTDGSGSTDFVYDIRGNLLVETRHIDGVAYATAYAYDSSNQLLSITYPSGTVVAYTRNILGRTESVTATTDGVTQTLASNIAYLPFGPIEGFEYGNGIPLSRVFDQDYRLTSQKAGAVQDISLGYDPANNIINLVDGLDSTRNQTYAYDQLNRLTHAEGIYGTRDYSYDHIGNRLTLTTAAGVDTYSYAPGTHHLSAISGPNTTSFTYDENGNTVTKGPLSFTYDDTNRVTEAFASGVPLASYTYNAKGERVKKARLQGASMPSETVLFSDNFSAPDGTVIDDQPDGAWRGKRPLEEASATVEAGAAQIRTGQAIRTVATFADSGDKVLVARATLSQGILVLKHPSAPEGVKARFNGRRRIAVTVGVFNDETRHTKVIFQLPTSSARVYLELRLRAGTARIVVTDDQGGIYDTGDLNSAVLTINDVYRLKLRAIKIKGEWEPGHFDNVQIGYQTDTAPSATAHSLYDQEGQLIGEYAAASTFTAEYIYLEQHPLAMLRNGTIYYFHTDHLGTPHIMTDSNQSTVWQADYTSFGDTIVSLNLIENPLRFPGQHFDQETGLHYNLYRYYAPSQGRYLRADPTGLDADVNTYVYGLNNPIGLTDRNGLEASFSSDQADAFVGSNAAIAGQREVARAIGLTIGAPLIPAAIVGAFFQSVPIGLTAIGVATTGIAFLVDPMGDNAARIAMDILPFCAVPFLPVAGAAGTGILIGGNTVTAAGSVAGGAAIINISFDLVSLIPVGLNRRDRVYPIFPDDVLFSPLPGCRQDRLCLSNNLP